MNKKQRKPQTRTSSVRGTHKDTENKTGSTEKKTQEMPEALKKKKEKERKKRELLSRLKGGKQQDSPAKVQNTKLVQRYTGKRGN